MAKNIIDIWKAVNPCLPLLTEKYIVNKLKKTCFEKAYQMSPFSEKENYGKKAECIDIFSSSW